MSTSCLKVMVILTAIAEEFNTVKKKKYTPPSHLDFPAPTTSIHPGRVSVTIGVYKVGL